MKEFGEVFDSREEALADTIEAARAAGGGGVIACVGNEACPFRETPESERDAVMETCTACQRLDVSPDGAVTPKSLQLS